MIRNCQWNTLLHNMSTHIACGEFFFIFKLATFKTFTFTLSNFHSNELFLRIKKTKMILSYIQLRSFTGIRFSTLIVFQKWSHQYFWDRRMHFHKFTHQALASCTSILKRFFKVIYRCRFAPYGIAEYLIFPPLVSY